jgi:pimeloyl-ACP methyl ester carboxylesterase
MCHCLFVNFNIVSRVYAFDLRGFGLSDRPAGVRNYTVDEHLEDLAEAIQLLKAKSSKLNYRNFNQF